MMQARTAKSVHERCNMSTASPSVRRGPAASLAMRYALRQLRGGLRGFYVFIACIALGVMAIAGVGSVAASLGEGLAREGRTLLGGDVAFSLIQREAKPDEVAFLRSRGEVSVAATLTAMVRSGDGRLALVEVKAVDAAYPMLGELTLRPKMQLADLLAERDGAFGVGIEVNSHIDRSRGVVATLKALGATGRDVFTIYLAQVIVPAAIGSVSGLALGAALPFIIVGVFANLLRLPVLPAFRPDE